MPRFHTNLTELDFRDDRGRPVQQRRSEMAANISGSPVSEGEWLLGVITTSLPFVLPAGVFAYFYLFRRWPGQLTLGPVFAALILGAIVQAIVRRLAQPLAGVRLSLPSVLAFGHCGACGYAVANTQCNLDGFHTCPECGAEWHRDRMVFAGRPPAEVLRALRRGSSLRRQSGVTQSDTGWIDDRGVMLTTPYRWPRGLFRSVTPPHAAAARADLNRRLGRAAFIFNCAVWATAVLLSFLFISRPTMDLRDKLWSCVILAVLASVIHALARMARMQSDSVRSTVLSHGLCPSCWHAIGAHTRGAAGATVWETRVEFDGCATCSNCRAAWYAGDVRSRG